MGGLPHRAWRRQPARIVTRIQVVDGDGAARKRSEAPTARHWSELWRGPPFVVYGHTPGPVVVRRRWTLGIDTACVLGGALTACVFPGRQLVQVKARKCYFTPKSAAR